MDWHSTCVLFPLKFLPFLIAATIFFSISLIVVSCLLFDALNIRFLFRLSFVLTLLFLFLLSKRHPIIYGVWLLAVFRRFLRAVSRFYCRVVYFIGFVIENSCGGFKTCPLALCIGVCSLTFESPTQEFRIGLCVFVRFGLATLVDCLFAFPYLHHV